MMKAVVFILVSSCFLVTACICQAKSLSGTGVMEQFLLNGVQGDTGYGPFSWGDGPSEYSGIRCVDVFDNAGVASATLCRSKSDLPYIGQLNVVDAEWVFKNRKLSEIELTVAAKEEDSPSLPSRFEVETGKVTTDYSQDTPTEGTLTIKNADPSGFYAIADDALRETMKDLGEVKSPSSGVLFLDKLSLGCPACVSVLQDFMGAVGNAENTSAEEARKLFGAGDVPYLIFLKSEAGSQAYRAQIEASHKRLKPATSPTASGHT